MLVRFTDCKNVSLWYRIVIVGEIMGVEGQEVYGTSL